ncbi:MAG: PilZ domain-containing protein [Acidobacteriia bacterium]|nr:PilZ domain-containing protein [Terriglobia bacterium]
MDNQKLAKSTQATEPGYTPSRRFPRWRLDARIQVSVFREGVTASFWGRTNELGEDGVGATLSGELAAGEVVSMEFPIPVAPFAMNVRAIVRYSHGLRCGFEFLVVTGEQKETLRRTCKVLANS